MHHTCSAARPVCRLLVTALLGLACTGSATGQPDPSRPLNVLCIAVDDLGNVLGPSRPPGLQTPQLDHLAGRGTYFERAYCQIPLCNPSRASILTGQRPDVTTVWDLDRHFRDALPDVVTLPQFFRQHGYHAARVGKIFHYDVPNGIGTNGLDDAASWDQVVNPRGRDVSDARLISNPTPSRPISAALSWLAADGTDEEQTDGLIATESIRLLEELQHRPFFLAIGFFRPHTPFVAPRTYFERYAAAPPDVPAVPPDDRLDIPAAAIPHNIPQPNYGLDAPTLRSALLAYYASVTFVDAQLGRVLDALDRLDLASRTLIVLWSDHGYHLGEHGLWQKRTLFDPSARTVLIIAAPGSRSRGVPSPRVVELVDLYPTTTDLALGVVPPGLAGRSLRPLLDDPLRPWDHPACTQILRPGPDGLILGRALTTADYRYIEWNGGAAGRELYRTVDDPQEWRNLAEEPESMHVIEQLRRQFTGRAESLPPTTPVNPARL